MRNPLSFTARTFNTIFYDLKIKFPDKPEWFILMLCGLFDIAHWYLDATANNALLESAYTPEAVDNLLAYLDYYRAPGEAANGTVNVTLAAGTTLPHTVAASDLRATVVKPDKQGVSIEALASHTFNALTEAVTFHEGEAVTSSLGISDGSAWQTFIMPRASYINGSGEIIINSQVWTEVDFLIESGPTDKVYRLIRFPDGFTRVRFGDGVTGAIPGAYSIDFTGRFGGGTAGNFITSGSTIFYAGGDVAVESLAFVSAQFSGGAAEETMDNARFMAPQLLKVNERAVTENDYRLLSLRFNAGIARAKCFPGYYGVGTVGIHVIPTGGGNASGGLKTALQNYLIPRTPLGAVDVRVRDTNKVTQSITVGLKMRPGTNFTLAQNYAKVFLGMLVADFGEEIVNKYATSGVAEAVTLINSYFSMAFTSTNYAAISALLDLLTDNVSNWGTSLNIGDIFQVAESIPNVLYSTVSLPIAQVNLANDFTFTMGTITVTAL